VLQGLDFSVAQGEAVVILGANGAGKTTTLRAISGMIDSGGPHPVRRTLDRGPAAGRDRDRGNRARAPGARHDRRPHRRREPAHRRVPAQGPRDRLRHRPLVHDLPPAQGAARAAGGKHERRASSRCSRWRGHSWAARRLVLLDEPSLGLAPLVTQELFPHARRPQPGGRALDARRRAERGPRPEARRAGLRARNRTIVAQGSASELAGNDDVRPRVSGNLMALFLTQLMNGSGAARSTRRSRSRSCWCSARPAS